MNWTIGSFYQTRDKKKAKLLLEIANGRLAFWLVDTDILFWVNDDGNVHVDDWDWHSHPLDIVSEWRDPARVTVEVYRHKHTGHMQSWRSGSISPGWEDYWELIARKEIIEGEGME